MCNVLWMNVLLYGEVMEEVVYETLLDKTLVTRKIKPSEKVEVGVIGTREYLYIDGKMLGVLLRRYNA